LKVLFDHNVDRRFRKRLPGHEIKTTREMRWETLLNGALLQAAAGGGFEAFISIDKKTGARAEPADAAAPGDRD
jgi:hypothetical protein